MPPNTDLLGSALNAVILARRLIATEMSGEISGEFDACIR
jgi:hypothetical protein